MREHRKADELRPVSIDSSFNRYAKGCALISFGHTRLLCSASIEEKQPPFLRGTDKGWVTAEEKPQHEDQYMQFKLLVDKGIKELEVIQNVAVASV